MIREITSSLPTYKSMIFSSGFNIVLAEKHFDATDQDTRNGVGKTSLIEIIHFLLGSSIGNNSIFKTKELENVTFTAKLVIKSSLWKISRNTLTSGIVSVVAPEWKSKEDSKDEDQIPFLFDKGQIKDIKISDWVDVLSDIIFGIASDEKYALGSRTLFGYLIRRQLDGAFRSFEEVFSKQARLPQQMAIMYFLGLDWTIAREWIILNEKEKAVKSYLLAAKNKDLEGIFTKEEDLRTQLALDRSKLLHMQRNFEVFQILPEYENLEVEADEIALRLREITDDDFSDHQRLDTLHESINSEIVSESDNLPNFIKQVEILFKESVTERLAKVREFHKSVMNNR